MESNHVRIQIRPYQEGDLRRLQGTLAQWIQEAGDCGYYHPGNITHRLYEGFGSGKARHDFVHTGSVHTGSVHTGSVHTGEEAGEIIGFTYSFVFDAAFFAFVAPSYRGSMVERELLHHAIATTARYIANTKRDDQTIITDLYDCDQIRIDLLTQLGFHHYRTWDWITQRNLLAPLPEPTMPHGFTIRTVTLAHAEQLAAIRNSSFDGNWTGEVYRTAVMQGPGYDPQRELVAVAPDGRIAAFTVIHFDELNKVGLFEPVGTHRDFRRLGLARAVLLHGLREMQRRGMVQASVEHTAENAPALALYRGLGFVKKYETLGFQRTL